MGFFNFFGSNNNNDASKNSLLDEFRNLDIEKLLEKSVFYEEHEYECKFN
jgi:hypothetical protein